MKIYRQWGCNIAIPRVIERMDSLISPINLRNGWKFEMVLNTGSVEWKDNKQSITLQTITDCI